MSAPYPLIDQKVICVQSYWEETCYRETMPVKGEIYTIREVFVGDTGNLAIRLKEIVNEPQDYQGGLMEVGFTARGFKPLDERTMDQLRALLNPTDEQAAQFIVADRTRKGLVRA